MDSLYNLKAGMTFEQIKSKTISINPQPDSNGEWFSFYPAVNDPIYKYFSCRISHQYGLTRICAWTQNIKTKSNGAELFSLFEHIRDMEQRNWGPSRFYHVLKDNATYQNLNEFTLSLINNDRLLMAIFAPQFNSNLPADCKQIHLQCFARDEYSGNIHKRIILLNDEQY